ncbi:TonB-dependent receptor plug domain-containing protein, partial [Pseudoalteromonas sp. TB51]
MAVSCQAVAEQKNELEHIQIISHNDKLRTEAGSATLIGEAQLEQFEFDDIHRILSQVPGVNIREEDGFGLRPNIGFRGVTPERSKKITILEDGVLIGPAPYSAPAAYYFPLTTRMTAVEVFK